MYVYIYIYIYVCVYIYIYIYIYTRLQRRGDELPRVDHHEEDRVVDVWPQLVCYIII